jgi:hypothetical protein
MNIIWNFISKIIIFTMIKHSVKKCKYEHVIMKYIKKQIISVSFYVGICNNDNECLYKFVIIMIIMMIMIVFVIETLCKNCKINEV